MTVLRETSHPVIRVDCPVCGEPLPRIVVDADARADEGRLLRLTVVVQPLDGAWWRAAREDHPDCLPPEVARRLTEGAL